MNLPKAVQAALENARVRGVYFPTGYVPPYTLREFSSLGKTPFDFSWESGQKPYDPNNADGWKNKMGRVWQCCYAVYCCEDRFTAFYLDKQAAKKCRDAMNIRHFNVAALANNPKNPVLI